MLFNQKTITTNKIIILSSANFWIVLNFLALDPADYQVRRVCIEVAHFVRLDLNRWQVVNFARRVL